MIKNVLFVGNSHTYLHYMLQMLMELFHADDGVFELIIYRLPEKVSVW